MKTNVKTLIAIQVSYLSPDESAGAGVSLNWLEFNAWRRLPWDYEQNDTTAVALAWFTEKRVPVAAVMDCGATRIFAFETKYSEVLAALFGL